jgi:hypothetical protein
LYEIRFREFHTLITPGSRDVISPLTPGDFFGTRIPKESIKK